MNDDKYDNNKMDENQLKFIKNKIESCILIGNPGCGKTTTIIEYCIHKYVNKLITSFLNFYIISFSKDASIDFILRGQKSKYPLLFNNNNIKTIHSLSYKILSYFNNIHHSTSINILILSAYKLIENKTTDELYKVKFLSNIKFIIIDEAQDINENQYKLASLLSTKLNIPLILVGDPNQNIYQFQGGSDEYLLNHSNKIFTLNYNYRSSVELVNFLNYIRPHKNFPEMKTPKKEKEKKPFLYVNDINNILQHIKKQLLVTKYNLEDIAIIGPVKLSKEELKNNNISDYKSVGLQLICNFLSENNIKFIKHFNDINDNNLKGLNETKKIKDHVNILTSHSSKGLEFKKVLVVNYQLKTFSTTITNYDYEKFKYLWYVTLSRAIHKLIIYIRIDHDIFYNIFDVPNNLYLTNNINKLKNKYNLENKLENKNIPQYYEITKIINDLSYLTEERMYNFLHNFKYTITKKTNI
jgi:superfamily I DNA/RNA helicase